MYVLNVALVTTLEAERTKYGECCLLESQCDVISCRCRAKQQSDHYQISLYQIQHHKDSLK